MLIPRRCLTASLVLVGLFAVGCAGSIDPDTPTQPYPQYPSQPQPTKPDTGWVCTTATCGGKCINNTCYPSNYQPPGENQPPSNQPPSNQPPSNPPAGNCPAPSDLLGSYEGTISGNIKSVIDVQVTGKVQFSVVDDGNGGVKLASGQVFGKALGLNFSLPMNGTVSCGKLTGTGTGELVGVSVDGKFEATFSAATKKFDAGTWSGTAPSNGSTGGGSWNATRL
ncbi:MAG: hypothetical protein KC503_24175 [Myxococcales bacterium]|nr:hypothetical protein [Myxococcales bacterium]